MIYKTYKDLLNQFLVYNAPNLNKNSCYHYFSLYNLLLINCSIRTVILPLSRLSFICANNVSYLMADFPCHSLLVVWQNHPLLLARSFELWISISEPFITFIDFFSQFFNFSLGLFETLLSVFLIDEANEPFMLVKCRIGKILVH